LNQEEYDNFKIPQMKNFQYKEKSSELIIEENSENQTEMKQKKLEKTRNIIYLVTAIIIVGAILLTIVLLLTL
jgi:uncharacterized membrane protein YkgB